MLEVFRKFGSIQFDPIAVAGRNHDLVLHARVAGYEPAWCDVLYERREIFETTNKALSFVPASEFPWFRFGWGRKGPRFHARILAENAAVADRVLGRIHAQGTRTCASRARIISSGRPTSERSSGFSPPARDRDLGNQSVSIQRRRRRVSRARMSGSRNVLVSSALP